MPRLYSNLPEMENVKAEFPGGAAPWRGMSLQALFKSGARFVKKQGSKGRQPLGGGCPYKLFLKVEHGL